VEAQRSSVWEIDPRTGSHRLPPDYMTAVKEGAFYGWPFSYYGQHVDDRVKPGNPDMVAHPVAGLRPGSPYGLAGTVLVGRRPFARPLPTRLVESQNPQRLQGRFCALRRRKAYRVAHRCAEWLSEFEAASLQPPRGVAIDKGGALLVADDVGNIIWRVSGIQGAGTSLENDPRARLAHYNPRQS
jgi:glucose/arabinose dehydrogenase